MFGRKRCLAHLHGQTTCTPVMDDIYGGVLALSDFIRENYLQSSTLDPQRAYILHNCIDTLSLIHISETGHGPFLPRPGIQNAARAARLYRRGFRRALLWAARPGQGHP